MKKNNYKILSMIAVFAIVTVGVFFITSCKSDKKNTMIATDSYVMQEDIAMKNLLDSIDALNEKYPATQIKGSFWGGGAVALADAAGMAAGGGIGGWVGGVAGSLAGPAGTVVGVVIGQRVGPWIGCFLASGAANVIFNNPGPRAISDDGDDYQFVYIISNEDSLGYYHNYMMTEINRNKDRYYSSSGSVDYDLMYEDIVSFLHNIGRYDEALEDSIVKCSIVNQIRSICLISERYISNPQSDELINEQCDFLKNQCYLQDEEVNIYRDYSVKILNKCITLDNSQIESYSQDLNEVISNSNLSQEKKEELSFSADLTINSAIYWNTNY